MGTSRRQFLQSAALSGTFLGFGSGLSAVPSRQEGPAPPGRKLNLLILGGTGFLGPHIVEAALARGHAMTLFNRGRTHPELFPDLVKLRGDRDPRKGEGLNALKGSSWDAVIDTSGYVPRIVGASANLLADQVEHYVFISTISVYAGFAERGMKEDSELSRLEDETVEEVDGLTYGGLKALCEQAAEKAMPGRVTNIRPGLIVGPLDPTDRFTYWPARVDRGGEILAPGAASDPVQFIDARDLANWCIHCIEQSVVGVFNAVGPDRVCGMGKLLGHCLEVGAADASLTWVEAGFLQEQGLSPWGALPVWAPPEGELQGLNAVSNAAAVKAGYRSRPVLETVRDTLEWFRGQPPERRARLRAGIHPDRESEVLAAWRARQEAGASAAD